MSVPAKMALQSDSNNQNPVIHSGHFMKSEVYNDNEQDDDEDEDIDILGGISDPEDDTGPQGSVNPVGSSRNLIKSEPRPLYNRHRSITTGSLTSLTKGEQKGASGSSSEESSRNGGEKPVTFYKFGPRQTRSIAIDVSLNQLNNCIHQAYKKLTTPKWKDFKGMRLRWKQRIRLNNVIWRAWHMEFVERRKKRKFCFFSMPAEDQHSRYEAAVLEGMYWKRRPGAVQSQYKRFRMEKLTDKGKFKKRRTSRDVNEQELEKEGIFVPLPTEKSATPTQLRQTASCTPAQSSTLAIFDDDDLANPFTDRLFDCLNMPYQFPNPKEMAQAGKADFIQPSLFQLQPSLEEIMQSLDANYPIMSNDDPEIGTYSSANDVSSLLDYNGDPFGGCHNEIGRSRSCEPEAPGALTMFTFSNYTSAAPSDATCISQTSGVPRNSYPMDSCQQNRISGNTVGMHQLEEPRSLIVRPDSTLMETSAPSLLNSPSGPRGGIPNAPSQPSLLYSQPAAYDSPVSFLSASPPGLGSEPYIPQGIVPPQPITQNHVTLHNPLQLQGPLHAAAILDRRAISADTQETDRVASGRNWYHQQQNSTVTNFSGSNMGFQRRQPPTKASLKAFPPETPEIKEPKKYKGRKKQDQTGKSAASTEVGNEKKEGDGAKEGSGDIVRNCSFSGQKVSSPHSAFSQIRQVQQLDRAGLLTAGGTLSGEQPYFGPNTSVPTVSSATVNQPLFIVQPCSNVQLPFVALPYSSVSTIGPGTSSVTLARDREKLPMLPYHSSAYAPMPQAGSSSTGGLLTAAKSTKRAAADSTVDPNERKRMLHLHAEQSRRSALKGGFEQLEELLPNLQTAATKPTNAVVLAKAGDYVRDLRQRSDSKLDDVRALKEEIQDLNDKISGYQTHLPASGPSGANNSRTMLQEMFKNDVKEQTQKNLDFFVFSKLMEPLFESFKKEVDGSTKEELGKSAQEWATKNCNLRCLRPVSTNILVSLATETPILTDPESFPKHVKKQIE